MDAYKHRAMDEKIFLEFCIIFFLIKTSNKFAK